MTRSGAEAFPVRAYITTRALPGFNQDEGFIPREGRLTLPLGEPLLAVGDRVADYVITEPLPSFGWRVYSGLRTLTDAEFADATPYTLLERRTTPGALGGVATVWTATETIYPALAREIDDGPESSGGLVKRERLLELTFKGYVELDPLTHRLRAGVFDYVVLEGRGGASVSTAKVREVRGGKPSPSPE